MDCRKHKQPDSCRGLSWRFPLDNGRKAESLLAIRQAASQKRIRKRPSLIETAWSQMRFHTWQHWAAQGAVLLFALLLALWIWRGDSERSVSLAVCSVFLVFAGNICLSSLIRLFSWHMAELEKTLYFDLKQMVCIRMLEAGCFDLLMLGLLGGCLGSQSQGDAFSCILYLLVPFLWSEIFYLHMLTHARSAGSFRQLSCLLLCAILTLFPVFWTDAYLPKFLPAWIHLGIAGFLLLLLEIRWMLHHIETGDRLCGEH